MQNDKLKIKKKQNKTTVFMEICFLQNVYRARQSRARITKLDRISVDICRQQN